MTEYVAPAPAVINVVAAPDPVQSWRDGPVPASAFKVGDLSFDVSSRRHCEIIRLGFGLYEYQVRVLYPHEDSSDWTAGEWTFTHSVRPDAKRTCLDAGHQ